MRDLVGFDNVAYEQKMLEREAKEEEKRKLEEERFWNQFPEDRADFVRK